jgi:hypothetical protein
MCKTCFDEDLKVEISGVAQLAAVVGGAEHLHFAPGWPPELQEEIISGMEVGAGCCLCPIDLDQTLSQAGFSVLREGGDVYFRRQP